MSYEAVIGLEVHVQLATRTKLFSSVSAAFGGAPNQRVDPYTLALPGTLPILNRAAVELALRLACATLSTVRPVSRFARKHYFYPDLPKGYQISQYDEPLAEHGEVEFLVAGVARRVRLTRIHLEEDAGKSSHEAGGAHSLVDLNRAGVPLVEVVSEPDLRSAREAAEYLRALRQLVRWLGVCDGNLEEGSMRCDANVSIRARGATTLGTRAELKNLNSFKHVEHAVEYEIARQGAILDGGGRVVQETRLWDPERGSSHAMRSKEEAEDYRYLPEPDLPPLVIDPALLQRVRETLPELPLQRRARYIEQLGLSPPDAAVLTKERALADYYEAVVAAGADPKRAASWVTTELLFELHRRSRGERGAGESGESSDGSDGSDYGDGDRIASCPIAPSSLAELLRLVAEGTLSGKLAKEVFAKMYASGRGAAAIVEAEGMAQLSDEAALEAVCAGVLAANPSQVAKYKKGHLNLHGFFVGQVMRDTKGRANPALVNALLSRLLA